MTATLTRSADYSHYAYSGYSAPRPADTYAVRLPRRHARAASSRPAAHHRAAAAVAQRPAVAIVHLRRRVVAALAFTGTMAMLWAGAGNVLANRGDDPASVLPVRPGATHVAQPGESLWLIAEQFRGDEAQADYVQELIDLNGGTQLVVGQVVRLP